MNIPKIKYQQFTFDITVAGQKIPIEVETDKLYNTVTGINIVLTDEIAKFSKLNLYINSKEIFPENYEILRLLFRSHAPFGFDFHKLQEPAGGSKVKGYYTDQVTAGVTYPYKLTITLSLENVENADAGKI